MENELTRLAQTAKQGLCVLLVDDNPSMCRAMKRTLGMFCPMQIATDGGEAVQKFEQAGGFPVVVTDQRMPVMTGDALIDQLWQRTPRPICLMMTGNIGDPGVQRVADEGKVFRLLPKPCAPTEIAQALIDAYAESCARCAGEQVAAEPSEQLADGYVL